jgi:O-antigen ligase/tetratricopeptide (TPR) repeat protein
MKLDRECVREWLYWCAVGLASGAVAFQALAFLGHLLFSWPVMAVLQDQRHWTLEAALAALLGAVALADRALDRDRPLRADPVLVSLLALAAIVLLQLVPLPAGLVGLLSPGRLRMAREVAEAQGDSAPSWLPLTACLACTRANLLLLVSYISIFYAASRLFSSKGRWKPVFAAAAAGAVVLAFHGLGQVVADPDVRPASVLIGPNRLASLLGMAGGCALALFLAERARRKSERQLSGLQGLRSRPELAWIAAAVVVEIALVLTLSRMGIASFLAAGALALALLWRKRYAWAAVAGGLLVLALNAAFAVEPVLDRYSLLFEQDLTGAGRLAGWRTALPLIPDHPVLGSGAGTFKHVFRLYQDPSLPGWWTYAHNDYLNLFTDAGVLGFAAGAAAISFALRRMVSLRASRDPETRAVAAAGFVGVFGVLIHSLADFPLQEPAVASLFFLIAGVACGRAARRAESQAEETIPAHRWTTPAFLAAAFVLCAAMLPALGRLHFSGTLAARAYEIEIGREKEVEEEELRRRLELLDRAAALDLWDAPARYEAARTRVRLLAAGAHGEDATDVIDSALRGIREGVETSPLDPRPHYLRAVLTWRPGEEELPDRMILLALRTAPAWPDVSYQVGRYFLMRWLDERQTDEAFGLVRWERTAREPDELFKTTAETLSFAAASPEARDAAARLVLDRGLSSREIDAVLSPDARVELALARELARRGEDERASPRFERALAGDELETPLHRVRTEYALSLLRAGRREDAFREFDEALTCSPAGEIDAVIGSFASFRPDGPELAAALADYWSGARGRLEGVLKDEPTSLLALGRAELAAGRDDEGFDHLLAYAEATKDPAAYAELAAFASGKGETRLAATLAAEAARLEPDEPRHHMRVAGLLERLGQKDAAASSLREALLLRPRDAGVAASLARLEVSAGRYPDAIAVWKTFIEAGGDAAAAHEALAGIYLGLRDRPRAIDEMEKAVRSRPSDERLRRRLEEIRTRDGPGG